MSKRAPDPILQALNKLYHFISHPYTFVLIVFIILGWYIAGYIYHFSEEWYKLFHIFEITVALLMVFLIEQTTHADNRAMQEKLDEIIKKMPAADNKKIGLERRYKGGK